MWEFNKQHTLFQATNLQLAWETLELASRIFSRQGLNALPNLAEVQTELGNIQFENQILDEARSDYGNILVLNECKSLAKNVSYYYSQKKHYKSTKICQILTEEQLLKFTTKSD